MLLVQVSPGLSAATLALHRRLSRLGRQLLRGLATNIGVDAAAFLAPLDPSEVKAEREAEFEAEGTCATAQSRAEGAFGMGDRGALDERASGLSSTVLRLCHYRGVRAEQKHEVDDSCGVRRLAPQTQSPPINMTPSPRGLFP